MTSTPTVILSSDHPSLNVSPLDFRFSLSPATPLTRSLSLTNEGDETLTVTFSVSAPSALESEDFSQLSRWVSFPEGKSLSLAPGESRSVPFLISPPDSLPDGGQYANLILNLSSASSAPASPAGILISSSTQISLHAVPTSAELSRRASLSNVKISHHFAHTDLYASSKLKNAGNVDFTALATFSVQSLTGRSLYETSTTADFLPSEESAVLFTWEDTPALGVYHLTYTVQAAELNFNLEKTVLLITPPVFLLFFSAFLLALISFAYLSFKRRHRR